MTLEEYRKLYQELNYRILQAQKDLDIEFTASLKHFNDLYKEEQISNRKWFIDNLDYILKHKEYIKRSPHLGLIVIDFLMPYFEAGCVGGFSYSSPKDFKIYLKDLLYLWENGFTYNDFPITEFGDIIRQSRYVAINYVEDNKEKFIILVNGKDKELISYYKRLFLQHKSLNIAYQYPNWQTYKTIKDMIKIVKKEN